MRIINLENLLVKYFEYKKDDKKFKKYLDKEAQKNVENGTVDNIRDNKQPEVSKPKWCTWMRTRLGKKKTNYKKKEESDNENVWIIIKSAI